MHKDWALILLGHHFSTNNQTSLHSDRPPLPKAILFPAKHCQKKTRPELYHSDDKNQQSNQTTNDKNQQSSQTKRLPNKTSADRFASIADIPREGF